MKHCSLITRSLLEHGRFNWRTNYFKFILQKFIVFQEQSAYLVIKKKNIVSHWAAQITLKETT